MGVLILPHIALRICDLIFGGGKLSVVVVIATVRHSCSMFIRGLSGNSEEPTMIRESDRAERVVRVRTALRPHSASAS